MFKLVVFCAFVVAATAKPGTFLPLVPITQYSSVVAPATTTISKFDSSVIHPTPLNYYSASPLVYTHLIKKRSPQLPLGYYAPSTYIAPTPYIASNPYVASAPLLSSPSILPAVAPISPAVHLIKKRSAPLLPTTYFAPQLYSAPSVPVVATSYASAAPLIPANPFISQPIAYTHLIKKRSAPLLTTYLAPTAYSHQSRFDLQTSHAPLTSISYSAPITYSSPLAYSHVY